MNDEPELRGVRHALSRSICLVLAMAGASTAVRADGGLGPPAPSNPAYRQECGACHVPFAPALLPAASWKRVMSGLPRHFGVDASVDAPTATTLSAWLASNAAGPGRLHETPPEDRITRSAWFERQHREVAPATWKRPAVKSAANCAACHAEAARGDFDEDRVRIPR